MGILAGKNSKSPIDRYFIEKDFLSGFKAGEFSIYDSTKINLKYRIESKYYLGQKLEVINQFNKQIIATLKSSGGLSEISILNSSSNQWINGIIKRAVNIYGIRYIIKWNQYNITMGYEYNTLITIFRYENHTKNLAISEERSFFMKWSRKYKLDVLSNELPIAIYLLALAVADEDTMPRGKG